VVGVDLFDLMQWTPQALVCALLSLVLVQVAFTDAFGKVLKPALQIDLSFTKSFAVVIDPPWNPSPAVRADKSTIERKAVLPASGLADEPPPRARWERVEGAWVRRGDGIRKGDQRNSDSASIRTTCPLSSLFGPRLQGVLGVLEVDLERHAHAQEVCSVRSSLLGLPVGDDGSIGDVAAADIDLGRKIPLGPLLLQSFDAEELAEAQGCVRKDCGWFFGHGSLYLDCCLLSSLRAGGRRIGGAMRPVPSSRFRVGAVSPEPALRPGDRVWMRATLDDMSMKSSWSYDGHGNLQMAKVLGPGSLFNQVNGSVYRIKAVPEMEDGLPWIPIRRSTHSFDDWRSPASLVVALPSSVPRPVGLEAKSTTLLDATAAVLYPHVQGALLTLLGREPTSAEHLDITHLLSQALFVLHLKGSDEMKFRGFSDWSWLLNQGFSVFTTPSSVSSTHQDGAWDTLGVIRKLAVALTAALAKKDSRLGTLVWTRLTVPGAAEDGAMRVHVPNVVDAIFPVVRPALLLNDTRAAAFNLYPPPGPRSATVQEGGGQALVVRESTRQPGVAPGVKLAVGAAGALLLLGLGARALRA